MVKSAARSIDAADERPQDGEMATQSPPPRPVRPWTPGVRLWAMAVIVVAPLGLLAAVVACNPETAGTRADAAPDPILAEAQAEVAIKDALKDPDSAKFGEEDVRDAKRPVVCGTVNAKNGFGGYTGMRPFIVIGSRAAVQDDPTDGRFVKLWNSLCIYQSSRPPLEGHHLHHSHRAHHVATADATPPA